MDSLSAWGTKFFACTVTGTTGRAAVVVVVARAIAGEAGNPDRFLLRGVVLFAELHCPSNDLVHFAYPSMKKPGTIQLRMSAIVCL